MTQSVVGLKADPAALRITELPPEGYGETCGVPGVRDEIDGDGLGRMLKAGGRLQLLDVREGWEREMGSIEPLGPHPAPFPRGERAVRLPSARPLGPHRRVLRGGGPQPARGFRSCASGTDSDPP